MIRIYRLPHTVILGGVNCIFRAPRCQCFGQDNRHAAMENTSRLPSAIIYGYPPFQVIRSHLDDFNSNMLVCAADATPRDLNGVRFPEPNIHFINHHSDFNPPSPPSASA